MRSNVRPLLAQLSRLDLIKVCNAIMVAAARDLAEFTKNNFTAKDIVSLALKCEELEAKVKGSAPPASAGSVLTLEMEVKNTLAIICEKGRRIWTEIGNPDKVRDYQIPRSLFDSNLSDSAYVA